MRHVRDSYENWKQLSAANRAEIWQLETLRGLARAYDERRRAQSDLKAVRQELQKLHITPSRYKSDGSSRDVQGIATQTAPSLATFDDVAKLIDYIDVDDLEWNYDRLVDKWRHVARANREARAGKQVNFPPVEYRSAAENLPPHTISGPHAGRTVLESTSDEVGPHRKESSARENPSARKVHTVGEEYTEMDVDEKAEPSNASTVDVAGSSFQLPVVAPSNISQPEQISFRPISPSTRQLPPISTTKHASRQYDEASVLRRNDNRSW